MRYGGDSTKTVKHKSLLISNREVRVQLEPIMNEL